VVRIFKEAARAYPSDFPPREYFVYEDDVTEAQTRDFGKLINKNVNEKDIDDYITANPVVLTMLLSEFGTGHHGAWVVPKKEIRSRISDAIPGLIPDFIVGGKSSNGFEWFVVELKGVCHTIFNSSKHKLSLSPIVNHGMCQIMEYMDYCDQIHLHIRDQFKLNDFRNPKGFLVVGRESETSDRRKMDLKKAFNDRLHNIRIKSYDYLLSLCKTTCQKNKNRNRTA
jgi:hypothetical protein